MPDPIGGIQPFAELARGRATVVYKGYQRDPGRFVLLKVVRPEPGEAEDVIERFEEEARLAARVLHPNVVAVLDAGRDGLGAYLVTEFVEGLDLRALVARGAVPPPLAAYVLAEAASGLEAVHAEGILHRDLKPANLLLSETGEVKLTDFGLSSLASSGSDDNGSGGRATVEVRGTLAYLAPEVVRGTPPGRAADLFSLGALLAEMLTGRPAFACNTAGATLDAVLHADPASALAADPRVPPDLAELAGRLLAKDPRDRLASASHLLEALGPIRTRHPAGAADLAAFLRDPSSYVPPPPAAAPISATVSAAVERAPTVDRIEPPRRRLWWGVAASVIAALGIAALLSVSEPREDAPPEETPRAPAVNAAPDSAVPDSTADAEAPMALPLTPDEAVASGEPNATGSSFTEPRLAEALAETPPATSMPEPLGERPADSLAERPAPLPEPVAEPLVGKLIVAAEPWARVSIDGEPQGTTPLAGLTLPAGRHTVVFENPEFPTHTVRVEIGAGEEERVSVSLWSLVGRVELVVSPWAEVAVDGRVWDTVPPQQRPLILAPGEHRLTFTHPALGTREMPLRIAAGESRTLRVNLADRLP